MGRLTKTRDTSALQLWGRSSLLWVGGMAGDGVVGESQEEVFVWRHGDRQFIEGVSIVLVTM